MSRFIEEEKRTHYCGQVSARDEGRRCVLLLPNPWPGYRQVAHVDRQHHPERYYAKGRAIVNFIGLTYLGAAPAEGIYVVLAKICTAYYFIHFLVILPLLGRIETPRPLPTSISESVLGKAH